MGGEVEDAAIDAGCELRDRRLSATLLGEHRRFAGVHGSVNLGEHGEITKKEQG